MGEEDIHERGKMIKRSDCLKYLGNKVTDELVLCSVAGQTTDWATLNDRDGNLYELYLSGTTPVALGLALALPHRRVISLDSDGGLLMGLNIMPLIAMQDPSNFIVIVFDNEAYDVQNQIPTVTAGLTDLAGVAKSSGIKNSVTVREISEFQNALDTAYHAEGASVIVVKTELGKLSGKRLALDSGRNKHRFINYIERTENIQIIKPPNVGDVTKK